MNRRDILTASPALLVPTILPRASVATPETPVAALFRKWERVKDAIEAKDHISDEELGADTDRLNAVEREMIDTPSQSAADMAMKFYAYSHGHDLFPGEPDGEALMAEVRLLAKGGVA